MFGSFAKLLMMCVLPTYVRSTATGANCTIVEWNIGIYGFFSQDFTFVPQGSFDVIRIIAFFDLDFQSTWSTTVSARWGPSFYMRSMHMNPCLRVRPLIVDVPNDSTTEYMKSQVNSFWTFGAMTVDVLVYPGKMPDQNALHSGANGKVSVGTSNSLIFNDKDMYPFLFRYADSVEEQIKTAYRYFVHFKWRSIALAFGESREELAKLQLFLSLLYADDRSPTLVNSYTIPSETFPYRKSTIQALIKTIQRSTTRLLYVDLQQGQKFTADPHCHPLPFNMCFLRDMFDLNVTGSSFQFLVNEQMIRDSHYAPGFGLHFLKHQGFHHIQGFALSWDNVNSPWLQELKANLVSRMKPSDYEDAYARYGINRWSNDTWKPYWEGKVLQGQALTGVAENNNDNVAIAKLGDMLAYIVFALNDVMNKYQPTSKSQISAKMIADAISASSPTWTTYGGPMANTMPYPAQKLLSSAMVMQRMDFLGGDMELPICCSGSYYRGGTLVYSDTMPLWGTGNASEMPPSLMWNCTPGQYMLPDGVCEWCPAGRYSDIIDQTECISCPVGKASLGRLAACEDCDVGKAASERQAESCLDCVAGTYVSSKGQSQCHDCELGKYSSSIAASRCLECGGDLTTFEPASLVPTACVCPRGTFSKQFTIPTSRRLSSNVTSCEACMQGLDCETDWPKSWNAIGNPSPLAKAGFYILKSAPYEPYQCCYKDSCEQDCPGGPPETCGSDRKGFLCNLCSESNYVVNGARCDTCSFLGKLMIPLIFIVSAVGCFTTYYLANGRLTVDADNPLAMLLFFGLLITVLQIFGIVKGLSVHWPNSVKELMSGSSAMFTLDANYVPLQCAVGTWPVALYMVQVLFPCLLLLEIWALYVGSKLIAKFLDNPSITWQINKTLNAAGQVMQLLFIAFCSIMVKPLQVFRHPNGKWSLKNYPRLLDDEGGDTTSLLLLSACICFGFLLPFVTWCVWGCVKAPSESINGNGDFLQRYRFLLYRFRPDYWWWGLIFLLRQTTLAFATVLLQENPHGQLFYTAAILVVYGFSVCRIWPWISEELSSLDAGTMLALVLIMLAASQYIPEAKPDQGRFGVLLSVYLFIAAFLVRYIVLIVIGVVKNGLFGEFAISGPDRIETSQFWLKWLEYAQDVPNSEIADTVCKMNVFDRLSIHKFMSNWNAVAVESTTGNQSVKGKNSRLERVPSRFRVSEEETSRVSRSSKRISVCSMGSFDASGNMSNFDQGSTPLPSILQSKAGTHMKISDQVSTPKPSIVGTNHGTDSEEMCTI